MKGPCPQQPTTAMCQNCHANEVAQFTQSRHCLPAYVASAGAEDLSPEHQQLFTAIPEGGYKPDKLAMRNALFALEGPAVTEFACETCHDVGLPRPMAQLASVASAIYATNLAWNRCANPKPATPVTLGRIIRSGRSIRNHRTGLRIKPAATTGTGRPNQAH